MSTGRLLAPAFLRCNIAEWTATLPQNAGDPQGGLGSRLDTHRLFGRLRRNAVRSCRIRCASLDSCRPFPYFYRPSVMPSLATAKSYRVIGDGAVLARLERLGRNPRVFPYLVKAGFPPDQLTEACSWYVR